MKTSKISQSLTLITMLLVGTLMSEAAFAEGGGHGGGHDGGHWGGHGGGHWGGQVGIYLGAPIGFRDGYYPYSYYGAPYYGVPYYSSPVPAYYPPVQPAPMIYTEQSDRPQIRIQAAPKNSAQDAQESWWYYCVDAKAYYPYVNQCPGGWLRVAPQPAPGSDYKPALDNSPPS
ncbi:MAG: hypothetical protein Q8R74_09780 [Methylophilus sp.]|nr:hypothetical protein [Methylophilus sp.]